MYEMLAAFIPALVTTVISLYKTGNRNTAAQTSNKGLFVLRWVAFFFLDNLALYCGILLYNKYKRITEFSLTGNDNFVFFVIALVLGIIIGIVYKLIRKEIVIEIHCNEKIKRALNGFLKTVPYLWAILCIVIAVFQCFDNTFWGDECYTILNVNRSSTFLEVARCDGAHPPLYFLIFKGFTLLLGQKPWVYHFVSVVPFILLILFSVFPLKKRFGTIPSLIFLLLLTMTYESRKYALEARMYEWAAFFVVFCFYAGYLLIKNKGEKRSFWILFCLGGLGAAYTHYFAFASAILIYFFVFVKLIVQNRKNWKKCIIAAGISLICYVPWLSTFFGSVSDVSTNGFWISEVTSIKDGYLFVFQNAIMLTVYIILLCGMIVYTYRLIWFHHSDRKISVSFFTGGTKEDAEVWMGLSAFLSVLFILIFQIVYGKIFTPVFYPRYMLPIAVATWLSVTLMVSGITNEKKKRAIGIILILVLLVSHSRGFIGQIKDYNAQNTGTAKVQELVEEARDKEDVLLLTDIPHLTWTVFDYYFPGTDKELYSRDKQYDLSTLKKDSIYIFLLEPVPDNHLKEISDSIGSKPELIMTSLFSYYHVNIYKVSSPLNK